MVTANEIFGAVNVIVAIVCTIIVGYWSLLFYKHRHHSLLVKRQSNLTIFICIMGILIELLVLIPFTLQYTDFSFLPKSAQWYPGLIMFMGSPCVVYGTYSAFVLRCVFCHKIYHTQETIDTIDTNALCTGCGYVITIQCLGLPVPTQNGKDLSIQITQEKGQNQSQNPKRKKKKQKIKTKIQRKKKKKEKKMSNVK